MLEGFPRKDIHYLACLLLQLQRKEVNLRVNLLQLWERYTDHLVLRRATISLSVCFLVKLFEREKNKSNQLQLWYSPAQCGDSLLLVFRTSTSVALQRIVSAIAQRLVNGMSSVPPRISPLVLISTKVLLQRRTLSHWHNASSRQCDPSRSPHGLAIYSHDSPKVTHFPSS